MKEKLINRIWAASIVLISVTTAVTSITGLIGISLPDIAVRVIGAVNLLSLAVTGFTTVQKLRSAAAKTLQSQTGGSL